MSYAENFTQSAKRYRIYAKCPFIRLRYGAVAHIPTMPYVSYLALLCPAMRNYSCK